MTPFVLPLADQRATIETAGGKGMSLARMIGAGLPVPDGFHVTTAAYQQCVAENGLQDQILSALAGADTAQPATLDRASATISGLFAAAHIPDDVAAAVRAAYRHLNAQPSARAGETPLAVRSSATAEDLPDASFAGQQETYLNIRGEEALLAAIKRCWASLWTARAIAYRIKNNIDQRSVALAVVAQRLVFAEAAGIMFTANPLNGRRNELVINAAWGLGEAIVGGAVTPDTFTIDARRGRVLRREIAEKQIMTVRTEQGTAEVPVPDRRRRKAALSDAQALELARLGLRIAAFYGAPMDVEWTWTRPAGGAGGFAVVQARPITALPPEWTPPDPSVVYGRGSLAEHTPSPVTPLFASLGLKLANQATAEMWARIIGKDARRLLADDGFYTALNGYVYGGVRIKGNLIKILKMSTSQVVPMFRGSVARWQAAQRQFAGLVEACSHRPVESLRPAELLEGARAIFLAACRYFTAIQTTLPAASSSEILLTRFYNGLVKRSQDPDASVFLLGFETMSLQAEKSLFDIAGWLRRREALAAYVRDTATERLAADLDQEAPPAALPAELWREWRLRFRRHLETFGRSAYEFDFANPTPAETPGPLLDMIRAFLEGKAHDPYERQRESIARREQATQAALGRLGRLRRGWFERLLRWAQHTGPMREDSIFAMGMGHPLIRRMLGELGRRLAEGGAIMAADEIYWLEQAEIEGLVAALERAEPLPNLAERIPARRAAWQASLKISPPIILPERTGWERLTHGGEAERRDGKVVLRGVGTSGGTISAPARVLLGPEDFDAMRPGEVLVAVTTTPAWTPLFAMAAAVVTDIGGPLSHSSIVAREYGIPAVMAARGATRSIQSGQLVTVDGSAGTVVLEQP